MEILIGLAVAAVVLIGIFRGNLFACVFLSIPVLIATLVLGSGNGPAAGHWFLGGWVLLFCIWLPRLVKMFEDPY